MEKSRVETRREKALLEYPEIMFINIYYSDFKNFPNLARNLLIAILDGWVKVVNKTTNFVVIEGIEDVIASLYEETPGWLKDEEQA